VTPRRVGRAAMAAGTAVALYTAASFGALLYAGLHVAFACIAASAVGVAVAALAARLVRRNEELTPEPPPLPAPLPRRVTEPEPLESRETRESREIQKALLPREVPTIDGYHVDVSYRPCGTLGGDLYDFLQSADGRHVITLGDVSGKGPPGAIVMAMVQTLFREHARFATSAGDLLERVNAGFAGVLGKGVFVTALIGVLDPQRHRFTLAAAGHHPALLLNPGERRSTHVSARGLALGLATGATFANALSETTIDVAAGDSLLLYTDGATECVDHIQTGVGEDRFLAAAVAAVLSGPEGALGRLQDDLWQGGGVRDDTTLVLVSRLGGMMPRRLDTDRSAGNIKV